MQTFFMLFNNSLSLCWLDCYCCCCFLSCSVLCVEGQMREKKKERKKFFIHCCCWTREPEYSFVASWKKHTIHEWEQVTETTQHWRGGLWERCKYSTETLWKINVKTLWLRTNYEKYGGRAMDVITSRFDSLPVKAWTCFHQNLSIWLEKVPLHWIRMKMSKRNSSEWI